LLTPDNRKRIKIREIFSHPWVIEIENELKEEIRKNSDIADNSNSTNASHPIKSLTKNLTQPIIQSKFSQIL
jgi:TPP-dependent pyruvate/acetoin dehydrogenase alpha subunit